MEELSRCIWHFIGLVYEKWRATWGQTQIVGAWPHIPPIETPLPLHCACLCVQREEREAERRAGLSAAAETCFNQISIMTMMI